MLTLHCHRLSFTSCWFTLNIGSWLVVLSMTGLLWRGVCILLLHLGHHGPGEEQEVSHLACALIKSLSVVRTGVRLSLSVYAMCGQLIVIWFRCTQETEICCTIFIVQ